MRKGFTLIELLVTMAIIGLLAGVLVFSLSASQESARVNAAKADINRFMAEFETYRTTTNLSNVRPYFDVTRNNPSNPTSNGNPSTMYSEFWSLVRPSGDVPNPPKKSGITYHIKTGVGGKDYIFCAVGGDLGTTVIMAKNGSVTETATSCPDL